MGSARSPRTRLPQRVYWVRRGVVLVVALALVFGIARLIGGVGSDPQQSAAGTDRASTVASKPSATGTSAVPVGPVAPSTALRKKDKQAPAVVASPSGACQDDEVSVLPVVTTAAAGGPIWIGLQLQGTEPACTFAVSPESLVVKIASGTDRIWSSQDCRKSIASSSVVVRSGTPVVVPVYWNGRRSDTDCSTHTQWAMPGFYHVYAAALGSTPTDVQFEVTLPNRPVVTRTAKPRTPKATATPTPSAPATSPKASVKGKQSKCGGDTAAGTC